MMDIEMQFLNEKDENDKKMVNKLNKGFIIRISKFWIR